MKHPFYQEVKLTWKQKEAAAKELMQQKQLSFGSVEADAAAVELFIAGVDHVENLLIAMHALYRDSYNSVFEMHCKHESKVEFENMQYQQERDQALQQLKQMQQLHKEQNVQECDATKA